ncbi:MAG: hypothetical protein ABH820_03090 [Patescibacteria group bacterium]
MNKRTADMRNDEDVVAFVWGDQKGVGLLPRSMFSDDCISIWILVGEKLQELKFNSSQALIEHTGRKGFNGLMQTLLFADTHTKTDVNCTVAEFLEMLKFMDDPKVLKKCVQHKSLRDPETQKTIDARLRELCEQGKAIHEEHAKSKIKELEPWKTIRLGTYTKDELSQAMDLGRYASFLFDSDLMPTNDGIESELDLVTIPATMILSLFDQNEKNQAVSYPDFIEKAEKQGLEPCPLEAVPCLAMQFQAHPRFERLLIATEEPLSVFNHSPPITPERATQLINANYPLARCLIEMEKKDNRIWCGSQLGWLDPYTTLHLFSLSHHKWTRRSVLAAPEVNDNVSPDSKSAWVFVKPRKKNEIHVGPAIVNPNKEDL